MKSYSSSIWWLNFSHACETSAIAWYKFDSYILFSHSSDPLLRVGCDNSVMAELNVCKKNGTNGSGTFFLEVKFGAA